MNWWHAFFVSMLIVPTAVWLYCEYRHARRPQVLPEPQPDSRDSIQRFRDICDAEET